MTVIFPPKFKASQLKQIARLCGNSRTGTKAAITDRIIGGLQDFEPLAPGTRVLSIDLGIRNLAYSLLEVPDHSPATAAKRKPRKKTQDSVSKTPILHVWERVALIPKIVKPPKPKAKRNSKKSAADKADEEEDVLEESEADATTIKSRKAKASKRRKSAAEQPDLDQQQQHDALLAAAEADPTTIAVPIEDFSTARLSALTFDLIHTRLLPLKPDLVIMELQRFRNKNTIAVYEWTLRVNSLESMLYAVFNTFRSLGQWPHGKLEGVTARNVLELMAAQEGEGANIWAKEKAGDNKRIKKDIVGRILTKGTGVRVGGGGVLDVVNAYLDRWDAKRPRKKKSGGAEGLKKLDDLADCLLQGIAFIRWQENKRRLLEGGVEALEDQMGDE